MKSKKVKRELESYTVLKSHGKSKKGKTVKMSKKAAQYLLSGGFLKANEVAIEKGEK